MQYKTHPRFPEVTYDDYIAYVKKQANANKRCYHRSPQISWAVFNNIDWNADYQRAWDAD